MMIQGQAGHVAGFESRHAVAPICQLGDEGGADRGLAAVFQARYTDQAGAIFQLFHDFPILARSAEPRIPLSSWFPFPAAAPLAGAGHNRVHCGRAREKQKPFMQNCIFSP